jgi:ATP-binding cassette subfamily B protein
MLLELLRRYLLKYRPALTAVICFQLVATIASLYLPTLNADIIDKGVSQGDTGYIMRVGAIMLGITLVQIIGSVIAVYFGSRAAMGFGRDVRAAIFHRVGQFSEREVAQFGAPSLITRSTNDVQQVQLVAMVSSTLLVVAPITCVGGIILALRQDLGLSWLMVVSIPVLLISIGLIVSRMVPQFRAMQVCIDGLNRILREQINGIRVVRAFVREPEEKERFAEGNGALTMTAIRAGRLMALMFPTVMLVLSLSSAAVLWFGGHRVDSGDIQIGSMLAFLNYLTQILMSVMMATFVAVMIPRAAVSAERIVEILNTDSSVHLPQAPVGFPTMAGEVVFTSAEFHYPGAEESVLRAITFSARPGQTTAIVGGTGAGKTTLVSLIPRLMDVTGGSVRIDGVDVREADAPQLWARLGVVPQRPYLFTGTVASNLRHGKPDATDEELWQALEIAQARDFVEAMPERLNAPIAQGGTNVSGGQRQRLAIARAVIRNPAIYIFDDSFSALDLSTDARLRAALKPHTRQSTVIIVAQRVSTIIDADQIVVLENGTVVGVGTHRELLTTSPTYAEIVASQLSEEVAA